MPLSQIARSWIRWFIEVGRRRENKLASKPGGVVALGSPPRPHTWLGFNAENGRTFVPDSSFDLFFVLLEGRLRAVFGAGPLATG